MSFGRIIFNFNSQKTHYLYPPFFPNTKAREENMALKGAPRATPGLYETKDDHFGHPHSTHIYAVCVKIGIIST